MWCDCDARSCRCRRRNTRHIYFPISVPGMLYYVIKFILRVQFIYKCIWSRGVCTVHRRECVLIQFCVFYRDWVIQRDMILLMAWYHKIHKSFSILIGFFHYYYYLILLFIWCSNEWLNKVTKMMSFCLML